MKPLWIAAACCVVAPIANAQTTGYPTKPIRFIVLEAQGVDTITSTPAGLASHLRSETVKWTGVVRAAGITLQ